MDKTILLPEIGEGIEGGTVISIVASQSQKVTEGDTLFELETDKAVIPFPSPHSGLVQKYFIQEGDEIKIGAKVALIQADSDAAETTATEKATETTAASPKNKSHQDFSSFADLQGSKAEPTQKPTQASGTITQASGAISPQTRKLARELGVDILSVQGSGRASRVSMGDLKNHIKLSLLQGNPPKAQALSPLPDFSVFGETVSEKASNIRMTIARKMLAAWTSIPHIHHNFHVDIRKILEWKKLHDASFKEKGSTLSPSPFLIKALAHCLLEFPSFNASLDMANKKILYKKYFNVGVAVDTPRGLVVPVIFAVDSLNIFQIGKELRALASKARDIKLMPKDMQGSCITLSNLGGIAGEHFTPIINSPEVAILGAARTLQRPVLQDGIVKEIPFLPLTLGYDHRIIDGAMAARFIKRFSQLIQHPQLLLMGESMLD